MTIKIEKKIVKYAVQKPEEKPVEPSTPVPVVKDKLLTRPK